MAEAKALDLDITLYPHRSLSRFGLKLVLGAMACGNLITALMFWNAKAWPVFGFMGLDLAAVAVAFWLNNRAARGHQRIMISGDEVTLLTASPRGETTQTFNRRWLRVELEEDHVRELVGRLFLVSHGKRHEVAGFLGADERRSLAQDLRRAVLKTKI